jgi:hypothetical protein
MRNLSSLWIFEVRKSQLEEIDDDEKLGPPEVGAGPQVDEAKNQQVVEDEMRRKVCRCVKRFSSVFIVVEQVDDEGNLDDEQNNPAE